MPHPTGRPSPVQPNLTPGQRDRLVLDFLETRDLAATAAHFGLSQDAARAVLACYRIRPRVGLGCRAQLRPRTERLPQVRRVGF